MAKGEREEAKTSDDNEPSPLPPTSESTSTPPGESATLHALEKEVLRQDLKELLSELPPPAEPLHPQWLRLADCLDRMQAKPSAGVETLGFWPPDLYEHLPAAEDEDEKTRRWQDIVAQRDMLEQWPVPPEGYHRIVHRRVLASLEETLQAIDPSYREYVKSRPSASAPTFPGPWQTNDPEHDAEVYYQHLNASFDTFSTDVRAVSSEIFAKLGTRHGFGVRGMEARREMVKRHAPYILDAELRLERLRVKRALIQSDERNALWSTLRHRPWSHFRLLWRKRALTARARKGFKSAVLVHRLTSVAIWSMKRLSKS